MSFIGNAPAAIPTSFQAVQADSFNGNGSTTNFTLSRQITNLYDIEVLVDNVQQSPYDGSYSVNGTTITFSSAPGSGTNNIYIIYRDHPITSIAPKGQEIELFSSGGGTFTVTPASSATDRTFTLPNETGTVLTSASTTVLPKGVPAFRVYRNAAQAVSASTWTKVQFNDSTGEGFDTEGWFDTTTNYRYQPLIAGYYAFSGVVQMLGSHTQIAVYGYKNGVQTVYGNNLAVAGYILAFPTAILYMNGSTDYFELYGFVSASGGSFNGQASGISTSLSGHLVRAA